MWSGLHHMIVRQCVSLFFDEIANYCTLWRQWPVQVHLSHSWFYCSQTLQLCTCEIKLSYNQTDTLVMYTMHLSLQVECWAAHIHIDCSKGQGRNRLRKRRIVYKKGKEVEIIPGRPWRANWHGICYWLGQSSGDDMRWLGGHGGVVVTGSREVWQGLIGHNTHTYILHQVCHIHHGSFLLKLSYDKCVCFRSRN